MIVIIDYEPSNFIGGGSSPNFHHHYPEPPEPIIEIIIQENNETLPEPQPIIQSNGKKKKEQVQVFYVKYHKDEKKGLVIHEPVAALSPVGHEQHDEDTHDEPIIVTPLPNVPKKTTTLRTIIRPESEQYESNSGVHVTFNHPHNHHSKSDNHIHDEEKVESAIQPVQVLPQSRIGPFQGAAPKEKRAQQFQQSQPHPSSLGQGRVVNSGPPQGGNFHHPPQPLVQPQPQPHQRPHLEFNPQNNFVSQHQHQGVLSSQLTLPNQDPSKPFHPNLAPPQQHHQNVIPINHQPQFNPQQQFGHQQFNQPPQRLPPPPPPPQQQLAPQQQAALLKPPQRPPVSANFNQNQRPFNYHAHQTQQIQQQQPQQSVRFPNQNQPIPQQHQQFPQAPNLQQQQQQQSQSLQRPQQVLPPRQGPIPNFQQQHGVNQQLPPLNRPPIQFSSQQFSQPPPQQQQQHQQQFPPHQGPPLNFRPDPKIIQHQQTQPLLQHNKFAAQQQVPIQQNHNIFQGGLVEQPSPNLAGARPHFPQQQPISHHQHHHQHHQQQPLQQQQPTFQQSQEDPHFHHQQNKFIQANFGSDVQVSSSVPKYEHHITETVNPPIFFHPTAVDMDKFQQDKNIGPLHEHIGYLPQQSKFVAPENQHRFSVNQQGGVSNHFSQVFPHVEDQQKHFSSSNFIESNGRNNFISESRAPPSAATTTTAYPKTTATTKRIVTTTTTVAPETTSTGKPKAYFDLPDEIPDDLRKQVC